MLYHTTKCSPYKMTRYTLYTSTSYYNCLHMFIGPNTFTKNCTSVLCNSSDWRSVFYGPNLLRTIILYYIQYSVHFLDSRILLLYKWAGMEGERVHGDILYNYVFVFILPAFSSGAGISDSDCYWDQEETCSPPGIYGGGLGSGRQWWWEWAVVCVGSCDCVCAGAKVLVCGPGNSGKSTHCRFLINYMLNR